MSDFPHPHTPTSTYPASHTAPFPSLHPQTEKVCHQGTNAIFPGGRRRRQGETKDFNCVPVGAEVRNQRLLSFPAVKDAPSEP